MSEEEREESAPAASGDGPDSGVKEAGEGRSEGRTEEAQPEPSPLEKAEARIRELEARAEAAEAEAKANHNKMLRALADFDNYRKRAAREADDARARGQQNAVQKLLTVFDNLERATSHVDASTDAKSMADGLRLVMRQFGESLSKLGIERVESVGKPFDPTVHESIQFEHHEAFAAGLVAKELQAGYRQGDSLLRPALVVVSKGPTPSNEPSNDPSNEPSKEPSKEPSEAPSDAASASDEPSKPAANESGGEQATDGDS